MRKEVRENRHLKSVQMTNNVEMLYEWWVPLFSSFDHGWINKPMKKCTPCNGREREMKSEQAKRKKKCWA